MTKTVLLTGATDGLGLETARALAADGHRLILHGRRSDRLAEVATELSDKTDVSAVVCDLSDLGKVANMADDLASSSIDVLINNAGVFKTAQPVVESGLDVRFVVNMIAPYLLTRRLLGSIAGGGRVINLSSAAQAPVDLALLEGERRASTDMEAYAQSKLGIALWTLALDGEAGVTMISVNPGSLLASKMVREGFGVSGKDIQIGVDIVCRAALSDEFANAGGKYYDNDAKRFASLDPGEGASADQLIAALDSLIAHGPQDKAAKLT